VEPPPFGGGFFLRVEIKGVPSGSLNLAEPEFLGQTVNMRRIKTGLFE